MSDWPPTTMPGLIEHLNEVAEDKHGESRLLPEIAALMLHALDEKPDAIGNANNLHFHLAQLRHAYTHLKAGRVVNQAELADGLISPAIQAIELALARHSDRRSEE